MVFKKVISLFVDLILKGKLKEDSIKKLDKIDKVERRIFSVWDFVEFKRDSQADHLTKVIGFDEWVTMDEIRRRIKEILKIEYKNERSLYPYIKTLVDSGFLEATNVGGKRKWKKNEYLFEIKETDEGSEKEIGVRKKIKCVLVRS